jgi:drug/metabolite transporter (DMT)-like permease
LREETDPRAVLVLLTIGGIWGSSFLFIKVLVDEMAPIEVVTGRTFFGMLAIGAFVALRRTPLNVTPMLVVKVGLLAVVANIAPFGLIAWGEEHIDSGIAAVLNATMPIFTSLVAAALLTEEKFTTARLVGLLLGFLGVIALTGDDILNITDESVLGQLAIVGAACCYAFGSVFARSLLGSHEPTSLALLQVTMAMVLSAPLAFALEGTPDLSLSVEATLSLLGLGMLGTGVAYILFFWLIDNIGSVRASLVTYVVPVIALVLGWLVLDESIGLNVIVGAALIIAGVASVMRGQAPASRRVLTPSAASVTVAATSEPEP